MKSIESSGDCGAQEAGDEAVERYDQDQDQYQDQRHTGLDITHPGNEIPSEWRYRHLWYSLDTPRPLQDYYKASPSSSIGHPLGAILFHRLSDLAPPVRTISFRV